MSSKGTQTTYAARGARSAIVIVGGGIQGLSIAYQLTKLGLTDVTVVESSYLCGGASGRNGGGIRAQWSSEANIRLMQESIAMCSDFAREMKINIWFRQGGYLFLVRTDAKRIALEESVKLQRRCGLKTSMLSPEEAKKIVPELNIEGVAAASFNSEDGVVFPWPFVWGYARAAEARGAKVLTHCSVTGFTTSHGGREITRVLTNRGEINCDFVINAAGAWSPAIANMVGVELPNHPHRHEICSTEPLKPWLAPLVADLESGLYFSQSMRGEIVGGISNPKVPEGVNHDSSARFLGLYAKSLVAAVPALSDVKILRQWAGCYDLTPDSNPIVGYIDEVENFYQASGFMGHGFMMAPVMGKRIARHIVHGEDDGTIERWNLRRFRQGKLLSEGMIIG